MDINIRLINRSNDANLSNVIFFQQNEILDLGSRPIVWKVVRRLGQGDYHPFVLPEGIEVFMMDCYGNYSMPEPALSGSEFQVSLEASGHLLTFWNHNPNKREVSVLNNLIEGAVSIGALKAGKTIALKTALAPMQKAVFQFNPVLFVAITSQYEAGEALDAVIISDKTTELNLAGVASCDVILSGGGSGPESSPFRFKVDNVIMI